MKVQFYSILALGLFSFYLAHGQTNLAKIRVEAGNYDREDFILSVSIDGLEVDIANSQLQLYEATKRGEIAVASELIMDNQLKLFWKINGLLKAGESKNYVLKKQQQPINPSKTSLSIQKDNGNLVILHGEREVLTYNYKPVYPPPGESDLYQRAGFIHPLRSPAGEVLTRIQPSDHYHHVGIWNPWTHTEFKGRVIDFWNLNKAEGTVKPSSVISTTSNAFYTGYKVLHDHIDLNGKTPDGFEIVLKEMWDVKVWNISNGGWLIDFISTFNNITDSTFTVKEYRYQGFGFRATEKWNDQTANILTSEGYNKENGNSTRARWCDINGIATNGTAGILFMTNPHNYNFPEPIRIWPTGSNDGKGNVFFNYNPAMDRDWIILPGQDFQLKYRMYVYDGSLTPEQAELLWAQYAFPPHIFLEKPDKKK